MGAPGTTIGFIGSGRVAQGLGRALAAAGARVTAVASRTRASAEALAAAIPGCAAHSDPQAVADRADLVFVTTPDDAIAAVAASIAWRAGSAVVHCSGALEIEVLAPARQAGAGIGGFHPMQLFEDPQASARALQGATIAVEAEPPLLETLTRLGEAIGGRVITLPPGARALYHASGSFANAFLLVLFNDAARLWERAGLSPDAALAALAPLARGTLDAILRSGPARSLAGPASRGDLGTIRRHLAALEQADPAIAATYAHLLRKALPLALDRGSLPAERAREIEALLATFSIAGS